MSLLGLGKIRRRRGRDKPSNSSDGSGSGSGNGISCAVSAGFGNGADAISIPSNSSSTTTTTSKPALKSCLRKETKDQHAHASQSKPPVSSLYTTSYTDSGASASSSSTMSSVSRSQNSSASHRSQSTTPPQHTQQQQQQEQQQQHRRQSPKSNSSGSSRSSDGLAITSRHFHGASAGAVISNSRKVRFQSVEIREFSRTVSDNPSCSCGPPIGISWDHSESRRHNINVYEQHRGYRKMRLDMVLSRAEREQLLLDWGVPFQQIVEGTRSALRVKNQRRQTIINSGKVAKIEETLEGASRMLKSALTMRRSRSHEDKMNQLSSYATREQQLQKHPPGGRPPLSQATAKDRPQIKSGDDSFLVGANQAGQRRDTTVLETVEPESDILDKLDMKVDISNVASTSPVQAMMMQSASRLSVSSASVSADGIESFDDYTLGATTLGDNSATPSQLEMERFYQELELECFGESNDIPSMVGQTLEVPAPTMTRQISIASDDDDDDFVDKDNEPSSINDTSDMETASSNPQSASFAKQSWAQNIPETSKITQAVRWQQSETQLGLLHGSHYHHNLRYGASYNQFHLGRNDYLRNDFSIPSSRHQNLTPHYDTTGSCPLPIISSSDDDVNYSKNEGTSPTIRQSFLDSHEILSRHQNGYEYSPSHVHEIYQSFSAPDHIRGQSYIRNECGRELDRGWAKHYQPHVERSSADDGPQIRHLPLSNYMSPSRWMEDHDTSPAYFNSTVTIMEDSTAI